MCKRIIELGERIIAGSTDSKLREHAAMILCYTSDELHDRENALKYADMCGSIYSSREGLRAFVTDGEDGVRATQEYLIALIQSAVYTATNMMNKSVTTDDESLTALDFGLSLLKLLFPDDRFGYMANDMSTLCMWKAGIYASRKDREKTLSALAESVSYAIEGSEIGKNFRFTAPLVNRVGYDPKSSSKNYKGNACDLRLEELDARFDFVRDDEKFKGFVERLKQHAEELQQVK